MGKYLKDLERTSKALDNLLKHHEPGLSKGMLQAIEMLQNFIQWEFEEVKVQESLERVLEENSRE